MESLTFLFDAGFLDDVAVGSIRLDTAELAACRFVTVAEAVELVDPRVVEHERAERVRVAVCSEVFDGRLERAVFEFALGGESFAVARHEGV